MAIVTALCIKRDWRLWKALFDLAGISNDRVKKPGFGIRALWIRVHSNY